MIVGKHVLQSAHLLALNRFGRSNFVPRSRFFIILMSAQFSRAASSARDNAKIRNARITRERYTTPIFSVSLVVA